MRFGLFYELQLPRPWSDGQEHRMIQEALDQVELADRLGYDHVWVVEHHFLEEYSHSSAPEVFLAACSQRTRNIRLGHGIVAVPPGYNHPARVAERVSMLDQVSKGRADFGTGETSSDVELKGFGVSRPEKRAMWEEAVPEIARMMVSSPYTGFDGRYFSLPPRNVIPKPYQQPHPPIWVACSRRDTIAMAARRGIGALSFAFINANEAREWADEYYSTIEACTDPAGYDINANLAVTTGFMCKQDEQAALDAGLDNFHFFVYSLSHYFVHGRHVPGHTDVWAEFEQNRESHGFTNLKAQGRELANVEVYDEGFDTLRGAIGTPDQIRDFVRSYEDAGIDELMFVCQAGRNRHEDICSSLELFAAEVMPEFKEREPEHQRKKEARLQEARERVRRIRPVPAPTVVDHVVSADPNL